MPQDYVQAHMLYDPAVRHGYWYAGKNRDKIAKRLTPEQITESQRLAQEWLDTYPNSETVTAA